VSAIDEAAKLDETELGSDDTPQTVRTWLFDGGIRQDQRCGSPQIATGVSTTITSSDAAETHEPETGPRRDAIRSSTKAAAATIVIGTDIQKSAQPITFMEPPP
jgi:hypothetical protein